MYTSRFARLLVIQDIRVADLLNQKYEIIIAIAIADEADQDKGAFELDCYTSEVNSDGADRKGGPPTLAAIMGFVYSPGRRSITPASPPD